MRPERTLLARQREVEELVLAGTPERWRDVPAGGGRAGARRLAATRRRLCAAPRCGWRRCCSSSSCSPPACRTRSWPTRTSARGWRPCCGAKGSRSTTSEDSWACPSAGLDHSVVFGDSCQIRARSVTLSRPVYVAGFGRPCSAGQRSQGDTEMHSRTTRGRIAGSGLVRGRSARRGSGLCRRQPVADRAPVHGALRHQHERRHRDGVEHAADLPGGRHRDAVQGRLRRRPGGRRRRRQLLRHAVRRRRRRWLPRSTPRART